LLRNSQYLRKDPVACRWPCSSCPGVQNTAVWWTCCKMSPDTLWWPTIHTSVVKAQQGPFYTTVKCDAESCSKALCVTQKFLIQQTPSPKNSAWNIPCLHYILEIIQSVATLMAHCKLQCHMISYNGPSVIAPKPKTYAHVMHPPFLHSQKTALHFIFITIYHINLVSLPQSPPQKFANQQH
jgi:hypothetical protein